MFLAGAAQHVLGTLGSLQQTAAGVQNASASSANSLFDLGASAQVADTTNSRTSGNSTWWSSPGTMNALLAVQDSGNAVGTSGLTAPAPGSHGGHHHHSHIGGNQQNTGQNADGTGATTGSPASSGSSSASSSGPSGGIAGLLSNLFNQQMMSGSASIGQSLSTMV